MTNVGFTIIGGKTEWMGGINYLKNLLFAISQLENIQIRPILFVGKKVDKKLLKQFEDLAIIKQASVFDRKSFNWYVDFIVRDIFKKNPIINRLIKENDIHVFSHSYIYGTDLKCVSVNWIPDFQHVHLPQMFSKLNLWVRNFRLHRLARHSDYVMLSSYDAYNDYKKFSSNYAGKARVIHFVSQTSVLANKPLSDLQSKYNFSGKFFYLPNQFWAHKNHKVVFEAINLLKEQCGDILLLCSGAMVDNRNESYIRSLRNFVVANGIEKNIVFLGLIPYDDVKLLIHYSIAIINPSYFEGWSSSVEEAKSLGKGMILSDIAVHLEQAEGVAEFFNYNSPEELAKSLKAYWTGEKAFNEIEVPVDDLARRTITFGSEYQNLILECLKNKNEGTR